jgi:hypothetical protein
MIGRNKAELAYIRVAIARKEEEAITELECLKELCAWYIGSLEECSITSLAAAILEKVTK